MTLDPPKRPIVLFEEECAPLLTTASSDTPLHRLLLRAHPVLMAAEGACSQPIARKRIKAPSPCASGASPIETGLGGPRR